MSPSCFLAPEFAEMVANGIVGCLGQGFMRALAEAVITLGNLPDCEMVRLGRTGLVFETHHVCQPVQTPPIPSQTGTHSLPL